MNNAVLQEDLLNQCRHDIFNYMRNLMEEERSKPTFNWVTNKAAMELLGVSQRTMQTWRDDGLLGFSQVGNKIYYSQDDLNRMLQRHYRKSSKGMA